MNVLPISEFKKLSTSEIKELMPFKLLSDGEPFAIVNKAEDVVVISDLKPAVQRQFRTRESTIRKAMGIQDRRLDYEQE